MAGRRARGGFTILEILIAIIVLLVGIVGILALFPVGISNVGDSTGDTVAANLAASVHAALVAAHRQVVVPLPAAGGAAGPPKVTLIHDLAPANAGTGRYEYELPVLSDCYNPVTSKTPKQGWDAKYPCLHPDPAKANGAKCFALGNDPWLGATRRDVRATSDNTEMYWGYGFSFKVRKVQTVPAGGNSGLYEYTIYVYRIPGVGPALAPTGAGGGGGGTGVIGKPGSDSPVYKVTNVVEDNIVAIVSAKLAGP
jgi:hypothetical protein